MTGRRLLAPVLAALCLGACSGGDQATTSPLAEAARAVRGIVAGQGGGAVPPGGGVPAGLSRAALAGVKGPLLLAGIEKIGGASTLRLARRNGAYGTWVSPDRLTVTLKNGVLTASRGLPGDLLAGEADATLAALQAGGASSYRKALRYIGGDREIIVSRLSCRMEPVGPETIDVLEVSHATRHLAEVCTDSAGGTLRNDYWLGSDNTMWQSRQFLHPVTGYILIQTLLP